ncbi:MAG TPA: M48 family metalloprotease [Gallionella sp.]|nr:M48 family metalloprotease [Gallionella sp.]
MSNRTLLFFCFSLLCSIPARAFDFDFQKALDFAKSAQQATKTVDEQEEIEIGHGIATNLLGASPLLPDNRVQQYVNHVGRWISLHAERPDLPWQFGVLDSTDVNAFATPGGTIFITNGLLQRLNNESELAGVLAHEMVHVLRKHHLAALQESARMDIASELAGEALKNKADPAVMEKAIKAGTEVYARGLDKDDEFEADRMGIVIATRAGYDPYGLPAVLQMLDANSAQDSSFALMFKTHPAPQDRLSLIDKEMGDRFDAYAAPAQADKRFISEMTRRK